MRDRASDVFPLYDGGERTTIAGQAGSARANQRLEHLIGEVMIKFILFSGWSIALLTGGAIVGWQGHQKVSEIQQNPWAIVQVIGGKW